jgi:23S rRNA (uracil1939-C5)-methyltransferase
MAPEPEPSLGPVRVEQIVYPGRCLAHRQGKVLFTDEGLPGETVEVALVRERPSYTEARTLRVLVASPDRREPRCRHYRACSPYQVIDYALQLRIKAGQAAEMLGRALDAGPIPLAVRASPEIWGYRNRVRFRVVSRAGKRSLAYREPGSTVRSVPVDECALISKAMNGLLSTALDLLGPAADEAGVTEIEARETGSGAELLLVLISGKPGPAKRLGRLGPELGKRFPLSGLVLVTEAGSGGRETVLFGRGYIEERAGGLTYRVGARCFFQVNRFLLESALEEIRSATAGLGAGRAADLYCGLGTFGLALGSLVEEVEAVESDPVNIKYLVQNTRLNQTPNLTVRRGTTEEWIRRVLEATPDLVLVDPPRKGLGPRVTGPLLESPPPRLLYLSCDPATLARDLRALAGRYRLGRATLLDFFPHTPHIETLVTLDRI